MKHFDEAKAGMLFFVLFQKAQGAFLFPPPLPPKTPPPPKNPTTKSIEIKKDTNFYYSGAF